MGEGTAHTKEDLVNLIQRLEEHGRHQRPFADITRSNLNYIEKKWEQALQKGSWLTKRVWALHVTHNPQELRPGAGRRTFSMAGNDMGERKSSAKYSGGINGDLYQITRARFVQHEVEEAVAHRVAYDVDALATVAARAAGSKACIRVDALPGGMHNKVLLLTMDDGKQVIAKLPYPVAGQRHFTTASEVATMDWLRTSTTTPVPKVLAWCSRAETTPVEAEYIIMEKAYGVPLKTKWAKLKVPERFEVAKSIAQLQEQWSAGSLGGYGSVYYASDLPEHHAIALSHTTEDDDANTRFVIGPTTGRDWLDEGRQCLDFDRGPWAVTEDYLEAVGKRELISVNQISALPPPQITLCGLGAYTSTRAKKLRAVDLYLQIYKHLAPSDIDIRKPAIWHQDLHVENIFVDPNAPTRVTCIIDWQSTEIAPLFVQARVPQFLEHEGPRAEGLERPRLPPNFDALEPAEQQRVNRLTLDQGLWIAYKIWIRARNPAFWKALEFQETAAFELLLCARTLLEDGEAIYAARFLDLLEEGDASVRDAGVEIPADIAAEIRSDSKDALEGMKAMSMIKDTIGDLFPEPGVVRAEQYKHAKNALAQCKEQIIDMYARSDADRAAWDASWPFDDE